MIEVPWERTQAQVVKVPSEVKERRVIEPVPQSSQLNLLALL